MFTRKRRCAVALVAFALSSSYALAQTPHLGTPISAADIAAWDIDILPDGTGLPPGSGTATQGAPIYAVKCALCHGVNGEGGISLALIGGEPPTNGIDTGKTIGNFWQYATTIFDYTRRAMPWLTPRTLSDDEVYALTAHLLEINDIISADDVMNAETLPAVQMPNRDGFIDRFPELMP
ncbi:MAG: cytochrome c [Gammaproteobacteria bacterium]